MSKKVQDILEHPPRRKGICGACSGRGFHPTGAISTKTCEYCRGTGKRNFRDNKKIEKMIRKAISP
jgi:DnaJ-class molecular chaperone